MGLKVLYEGGVKIPVLPSQKEWHTWDLCTEQMRKEYPLFEEIPYREIDTEHTVTCHLLHIWSREGAKSLSRTDRKMQSVVTEWRNRVYRLFRKAEMKYGADQHVEPEKKRSSFNLVNSADSRNQPAGRG
jgi:hypothetical protein